MGHLSSNSLAIMRLLLIVNLVILCIGIGYSFRITEFLEDFVDERQDGDVSDQIVPVFIIAFFASLVNSLLAMNKASTTSSEYYWCYEGDCGADTWGTYYENCNGMRQSPIDIMSTGITPTTETTPMSMGGYEQVRIRVVANDNEHYDRPGAHRMSDSALKNNGHTVQLDVATPGTGVGVLSGADLPEDYQILQLHFHWGKTDARGSEHTLNGVEYPLELHIVHVKSSLYNDVTTALNTGDGLAVTGFFFEVDSTGAENAALKPLTDAIQNIVTSGASLPFTTSGFRLDQLIDGVAPISGAATAYSRYEGSLTTPTCNEAVKWINFLTPLKISSMQLAMFRTMMDGKGKPIVDNYRPPQPLNGRTPAFYVGA